MAYRYAVFLTIKREFDENRSGDRVRESFGKIAENAATEVYAKVESEKKNN